MPDELSSTCTVTVVLDVAVEPLAVSVDVACTPSVKSPAVGEVSEMLVSVQVDTSAVVLPAVAVNVCVPSVSVAPTGIASMVVLSVSEPSVSVSALAIDGRLVA